MEYAEHLKVGFTVVSLLVSFVALIISVGNMRRDKYKIQRDYVERLISWHFQCVQNMIRLREIYKNAVRVEDQKPDDIIKLLSELSALIEQGRFFFPNINKGDGFGNQKQVAYQGYRNLALDMLVYTYNLFANKEPNKNLRHAERFQREFTSIVYEILKENKVTEKLHKMTDKFYIPQKTYEDYLKEDPQASRYIR